MMDAWAITAAVFMLFSVSLTFYAVIRHLNNFTKPYLQRYIIRILLMVPIYSTNAWLVMILPSTGIYLDSLREVYESFVIYSFMQYLLNFLKYDTNLQQYIDHKPGPSHIFPFCLLPTCIGGPKFMVRCKDGILQYVIVRPITTLLAFASKLGNFYGEGNYNPLSGATYPVLLIVNNLSQIMAMYCLVIFYSGYRQELAPMRPLAKFFSIKLVVFFSFFQSVVIAGLMEIPVVEETFLDLFPELNDKIALGRKLQEFLICFDMLLAAIGHQFAFTHKPFVRDDDYMYDEDDDEQNDDDDDQRETFNYDQNSVANQKREEKTKNDYESARVKPKRFKRSQQIKSQITCCEAFRNLLDFSDERSDIQEHFNQMFNRVRGVFRFKQPLPTIVSSNNPGASHVNRQMSDEWMNDDPDRNNSLIDKNTIDKNYQTMN